MTLALRILVTGGTFDKVYHPTLEQMTFEHSHVPEMIAQGKVTAQVAIEQLMLKDSLYMTDDDRQLILQKCRSSLEGRILVTHGTGTMVETAQLLGRNITEKTVVLTGAMVPYCVSGSDALFNFAGAFYAASLLPSGVYVAMNGEVVSWDNVRKNTDKSYFETIALVKS